MTSLDYALRVSQMNGRLISDDSTRTVKQQRDDCLADIKARGRRPGKEFLLPDQSGFDVLDTLGPEIIERVRTGQSAGVVAAYGDRLSRNWMKGGTFLDGMLSVGGEVWDASDPTLDYRTDNGRSMWGMKFIMAEGPVLRAKKGGKDNADALVEAGVPNLVSYGYRRNGTIVNGVCVEKVLPERDKKVLVPDAETAPVVRRIFRMRCDGIGWTEIADTLNVEGIASPRGGRWTHGTLTNLIENEVYIGVVKLGNRRNDNAHEPLVSKREWRQAQSAVKRQRSGRFVQGIAGGLLRCSTCGLPMSVSGLDNYACRRRSSGVFCEKPMYVSREAADDFVVKQVLWLLGQVGEGGLVATQREIDAARALGEQRTTERDELAERASTMDARRFEIADRAAAKREQEAWAAHEALVERAGNTDAVTSPSAWHALGEAGDKAGQARFAHSVISEIVVAPPLFRSKFAPIDERFKVRWADGREDAGAAWEAASKDVVDAGVLAA